MRLALLACSACWTGSATPAPPAPAPRSGRCEIRDSDVTIAGLARLSVEGKAFAQQAGPFARFEVGVRGTTGRVRLEDDHVALEGDLDLGKLAVRPRDQELRDGWLEVRKAAARDADGDALRIAVPLPDGLDPERVLFVVPCRGLTFSQPPDPAEVGELETVELPIHTQLRAKPDGTEIARVIGRRDPDVPSSMLPVHGYVLERRGSMTQLRIAGANSVIAWASSRALRPATDTADVFGFGRSADNRDTAFCKRDVPIYVRIEDRMIRVGQLKKELQFHLARNSPPEEVRVDLGLPRPDVYPFIDPADFKAVCDS